MSSEKFINNRYTRINYANEGKDINTLTDNSFWPFLGELTGMRLKNISTDYWQEFLKYNNSGVGRSSNVMVQLYYYAKRRINIEEIKKPKGNWVSDTIWINNGEYLKRIKKDQPIPEGYVRGNPNYRFTRSEQGEINRLAGSEAAWKDPIKRSKRIKNLSKSKKLFWKTARGKEIKKQRSLDRKKRELMKKHTKIYLKFFNRGISDPNFDELIGVLSADIHHINNRGAGGSNKIEDIENLMALDRDIHILYGDKTIYMDFLTIAHYSYMNDEIPYVQKDPHNEYFNILEKFPEKWRIVQHFRNQ